MSNNKYTVLITGANRGLGLEFVKQYAAEDYEVIACTRKINKNDDLHRLKASFENISIQALATHAMFQEQRCIAWSEAHEGKESYEIAALGADFVFNIHAAHTPSQAVSPQRFCDHANTQGMARKDSTPA